MDTLRSEDHYKFPLTTPHRRRIDLDGEEAHESDLIHRSLPLSIALSDADRDMPSEQLFPLLGRIQNRSFASKIANLEIGMGIRERNSSDEDWRPHKTNPESDALNWQKHCDRYGISFDAGSSDSEDEQDSASEDEQDSASEDEQDSASEDEQDSASEDEQNSAPEDEQNSASEDEQKPAFSTSVPNAVIEILCKSAKLAHLSVHSGWLTRGRQRHALRSHALTNASLQSLDLSFDVRNSEDAILHHHYFPANTQDYALMKHVRTLTLPLRAPDPVLPTSPLSNLTSLVLHHCDLLPAQLRSFLEQTPRLEQLQFHGMYHFGAAYWPPKYMKVDVCFDLAVAEGILDCSEFDTALEPVRETLQSLVMTLEVQDFRGYDHGYGVYGKPTRGYLQSLASFPRLRALSLPFVMLTGWEQPAAGTAAEADSAALWRRLPDSLQHLRLVDDLVYDCDVHVAEWRGDDTEDSFRRGGWTTEYLLGALRGLVPYLALAEDQARPGVRRPSLELQFWEDPAARRAEREVQTRPWSDARRELQATCATHEVRLKMELGGSFMDRKSCFEDRFTGRNGPTERFLKAKALRVQECIDRKATSKKAPVKFGHPGQVTERDVTKLWMHVAREHREHFGNEREEELRAYFDASSRLHEALETSMGDCEP